MAKLPQIATIFSLCALIACNEKSNDKQSISSDTLSSSQTEIVEEKDYTALSEQFIQSLNKTDVVLGQRIDNEIQKIYYSDGALLFVHNLANGQTKEISYEQIEKDNYFYIYSFDTTKMFKNHLYVITNTGAMASGWDNSVFYFDTDNDSIVFFRSADNVKFIGDDSISIAYEYPENEATAKSPSEYRYVNVQKTIPLQ